MKLFFVSLGCDKNRVDSEKMIAIMSEHQYEITDVPEEAEVIIVNTCGFISDAKEESIETLLEMAEFKKEGCCRALISAGCLAQRYAAEIKEEIPEVDGIVGTTAYDQIFEVVTHVLEGKKYCCMNDLDYLPHNLTSRVPSAASYVSYLKIAEGCNKRCSYCIIPSLRGNYRSVPMEELLKEAELLAEQGAKELILVAQETTLYGLDLYRKKSLPQLLHKLAQVQGIEWIRILYCYPEEITDELLYAIRDEEKVCAYLDVPIQHCNDDILRAMGRQTNKQELIERIAKVREIVPDIALRTTLISGFPGETEQQHEECVDFVAHMKFDRLGVFPYSPEEGTKAAEMKEQLEDDLKRQWADEIMEAEQQVIFEENESMVGKVFRVIVDGYLAEEDVYMARTYRDAPNVDGCVFFHAPYEIMSGAMLSVMVTDANGYDLIGEIVSEEESYESTK